jgi:hypothetical protein
MSDIQEPFEEESEEVTRRPRWRPPSVFWPLVLIGAGIILLLSNLGYLPSQTWNLLWRLWPLLLVALGIDLLIGRRSVVGAIVSALIVLLLIGGAAAVVFFARDIPVLVQVTGPIEMRTEHVEYPLTGVERASVSVDWTSVPGYLSALRDSPNLIQGDVAYRGRLNFDASLDRGQADVILDSHFTGFWLGPLDLRDQEKERWDVKLSPKVPLDLTFDAGSGPCDFDLTGLQIDTLFLDTGSGPIELVLPSGNTFEAQIHGGSGPIAITLPESVGARVELNAGSGPFRPSERFRLVGGERDSDGVWETQDFRTAEHTVVLMVDQGSGPIHIR